MKLIFLSILWVITIGFIFTQIILPIFTKLRFFWWFYPPLNQVVTPKPKPEAKYESLEELEKEAEQKTEGYKQVMDDIHGVENTIEKIKRKTEIKPNN